MAALFVDTGTFYAAADASDRHHAAASAVLGARGRAADLAFDAHFRVYRWGPARRRALRVVP